LPLLQPPVGTRAERLAPVSAQARYAGMGRIREEKPGRCNGIGGRGNLALALRRERAGVEDFGGGISRREGTRSHCVLGFPLAGLFRSCKDSGRSKNGRKSSCRESR